MTNKPPITAADVPPEWIAACRQAMSVREGVPVRANPLRPSIEAYSIARNGWGEIMLPGSGFLFTSFDDRNLVLHKLTSK